MDEKRIARFWSKVDKSSGPGGCWIWTAAKSSTGYGHIKSGGRLMLAHRLSWELANGPIPVGEGSHGTCVLHRCDVPMCVNPAHLFLGTNAANIADKIKKGRQQHGEGHGSAKLTEEQVRDIYQMRASGLTQREISVRIGVCAQHVSRILSGRKWARFTPLGREAPGPEVVR